MDPSTSRPTLDALPTHWRTRANQLHDWGANEEVVRLWNLAAIDLEQALQRVAEDALTLTEASRLTGLTRAYLGDLVRANKLRNVGRKHAPRVMRGDLPIAARHKPEPHPPTKPATPKKRRQEVLEITKRVKRQ
ncbi:MAG: hypothetical protein ACREX4_20775 [Gammaproteobacteria bacterium]